jgi:hypothetical protein
LLHDRSAAFDKLTGTSTTQATGAKSRLLASSSRPWFGRAKLNKEKNFSQFWQKIDSNHNRINKSSQNPPQFFAIFVRKTAPKRPFSTPNHPFFGPFTANLPVISLGSAGTANNARYG